MEVQTLKAGSFTRTKDYDDVTGRAESTWIRDLGVYRQVETGIVFGGSGTNSFSIVEGDPLSAFMDCRRTEINGRGEVQTRVETHSTWSSDTTHFHLTNVLEGYEGDTRVFAKTWHATLPRDLV